MFIERRRKRTKKPPFVPGQALENKRRKHPPIEIPSVFNERLFFRIYTRFKPNTKQHIYTAAVETLSHKVIFTSEHRANKSTVMLIDRKQLSDDQINALTTHFKSDRFYRTYIIGIYREYLRDGIKLSNHDSYGEEVFCADLEELYLGKRMMYVS